MKNLYQQLKLSDFYFTIIVIDMKKALITTRFLIFSDTAHLLWTWHINNNVLINCKKSFITKKTWEKFFVEWKSIMYALSESKNLRVWNDFVEQYNAFMKNVWDICMTFTSEIIDVVLLNTALIKYCILTQQ